MYYHWLCNIRSIHSHAKRLYGHVLYGRYCLQLLKSINCLLISSGIFQGKSRVCVLFELDILRFYFVGQICGTFSQIEEWGCGIWYAPWVDITGDMSQKIRCSKLTLFWEWCNNLQYFEKLNKYNFYPWMQEEWWVKWELDDKKCLCVNLLLLSSQSCLTHHSSDFHSCHIWFKFHTQLGNVVFIVPENITLLSVIPFFNINLLHHTVFWDTLWMQMSGKYHSNCNQIWNILHCTKPLFLKANFVKFQRGISNDKYDHMAKKNNCYMHIVRSKEGFLLWSDNSLIFSTL